MSGSKGAKLGNKLFLPVLIVNCVVLAFVLQLGFIFVLLALLPSVVAYYIENSSGKASFKVVASCNVAALLPTITPIMMNALKMEKSEVMTIMADPLTWLIIYGGAAIGWILLFLCRYIARFFVIVYLEYQIASLERFQKRLLGEWGNQIQE